MSQSNEHPRLVKKSVKPFRIFFSLVVTIVCLESNLCHAADVFPPFNGMLNIRGSHQGEVIRIRQDDANDKLMVSHQKEVSFIRGFTWVYRPFSQGGPYLKATYLTFFLTVNDTFPSSTVVKIDVRLGNGDESLSFSLQSDVVHAKEVIIGAIRGTNKIDLALSSQGPTTLHEDMTFDITGGTGPDTINVNYNGSLPSPPVRIDTGKLLRINVNGRDGADTLHTNYTGQINGHLDIRTVGSTGADSGGTHVVILPGSFGTGYYEDDNLPVPRQELPLTGQIALGSMIGLLSSPLPPGSSVPSRSIYVNEQGLTTTDIQALELELRTIDPNGRGVGILPHELWYDRVSGATGAIGWGAGEFVPPHLNLPVATHLMLADVSTRNCNTAQYHSNQCPSQISVNGRVITQYERGVLEAIIGRPIDTMTLGTSFWLHNDGDAGVMNADGTEGQWLVDLTPNNNNGQPGRPGPFSTYDHTGISILSDGDYVDVFVR